MRKRGATFRKRVDPQAWLHTIDPQRQIDETLKVNQGIALHVSLESLRTGFVGNADAVAVISAYNTIANAFNVSLMLCASGLGDDLVAIGRAQDALQRLWQRGSTSGIWRLDDLGWQHFKHAAELYEAQLAVATSKQVSDAIYEIRRRVKYGEF